MKNSVADDILARIVAAKKVQVKQAMAQTPLATMRRAAQAAPAPRQFAKALTDKSTLPVIAEIKRRSPSRGVLCDPFAPQEIAAAAAHAGAACLSVLTDEEFFGGSCADLQAARAACALPVLRKDFMLNEWQIFQSRALGADAILLIVAILDDITFRQLAQTADELGMAVLIEVHDAAELARAQPLPAKALLGINNRNLKTFHTDIQTTLDLLPAVRQAGGEHLLVSESGIHQRADVLRLQQAGVDAFLIGEALAGEPQSALARLFKSEQPAIADN